MNSTEFILSLLRGSHSFTCSAHPAFIRYRNEPYLPLPSQPKPVLIYRYRPRRDGRLSWIHSWHNILSGHCYV